jgi:hypothetical protein
VRSLCYIQLHDVRTRCSENQFTVSKVGVVTYAIFLSVHPHKQHDVFKFHILDFRC